MRRLVLRRLGSAAALHGPRSAAGVLVAAGGRADAAGGGAELHHGERVALALAGVGPDVALGHVLVRAAQAFADGA